MGLCQKLEDDMKAALKEGDSVKLSVLRMLVSDVKMVAIKKNVKEVADPDVLQTIQRHIKQHKESIEQFMKGSRQDLVDKEAKELKILEVYMPNQMSEDELISVVKDAISTTGAITKADMGKVMKVVMEKARGKADGKTINQLIMGLLK
jgi:hypothetical protein